MKEYFIDCFYKVFMGIVNVVFVMFGIGFFL